MGHTPSIERTLGSVPGIRVGALDTARQHGAPAIDGYPITTKDVILEEVTCAP